LPEYAGDSAIDEVFAWFDQYHFTVADETLLLSLAFLYCAVKVNPFPYGTEYGALGEIRVVDMTVETVWFVVKRAIPFPTS
jgi:hypothetical protein